MVRSATPLVSLVAGPLLIGAASATAAAGTPDFALARAQRVPAPLLSSEYLAFEHPQRSVLDGTSLIATTVGSSYVPGDAAGATWNFGSRFAVAGLVQRVESFRTVYGSVETLPLVSGQIAGRVGPARLGAAFRRGRTRDSRLMEQVYLAPEQRYYDYDRATHDVRELALGSGFTMGEVEVDLTTALTNVNREGVGRSERSGEPPLDSVVRVDTDDRWGGSLRARIPVPAGADVTLAVAFQDLRGHMTYSGRSDLTSVASGAQDLYGHAWSAGTAVSYGMAGIGRVRLHGAYRDVRSPGVPDASSSLAVTAIRNDQLEAGVSLRRDGWWGTVLYAGASVVRTRTWAESLRWDARSWRREATHEEGYGHGFAWGASRSVGDFDFGALVSPTLSPADPVLDLDVRIRF